MNHRTGYTLRIALIVATSFGGGPGLAGQSQPESPLLLTGGWVIDGTGGPVRDNAWVRIVGEQITEVGTGSPPRLSGGRVIDLRGKTLIPGLSDMHVHLGEEEEAAWKLKLLLAHGVTTVKDSGNRLGNIAAIRRWMAREHALPHAYFSNVPIQGSYSEQRFLQEGREIEELVDDYVDFGVDFIKTYNWLSTAGLRQVASLARERDVRVTGHTPLGSNSISAIDAGLEILEHIRVRPWEVLDEPELVGRYPIDAPYVLRTNFWAHFDGDELNARRTLEAWAKRRDRFFITPTLAEHEATVVGYDAALVETPDLRLVSPALLARWRDQPPTRWGELSAEETKEAEASVGGMVRFVGMAHDRGVRVLTGSDVGMAWVVPGVSLHREFELLARAGLSPVEIVHASTGLAAQALREPRRGTIEPGRRADLVILAGNLSEAIERIHDIEQVVLGGELYERRALLAEAARLAAAHLPRADEDRPDE